MHCPQPICAPTPHPACHQEPTQGTHGAHYKLCNIGCTHAQASHRHSGHTPTRGYAFTVQKLALSKLAANHFIGAIIDKDTGAILEYHHLVKNPVTIPVWETSFVNEIGHLFQGIREHKGTNTYFFIKKSQVPTKKWPTYGQICCNFCPQKREQNPTRLTVGGN
jgi:hypothetical protein